MISGIGVLDADVLVQRVGGGKDRGKTTHAKYVPNAAPTVAGTANL
jgi:hypothetical protein